MISLIMPVWVTTPELYELTSNALASFGKVDELIIIDNASTMGSDQFLPVADIYLKNKENLGYPKAVNQGLELASGDLIAVANNDIRVSPLWQEVTKEVFEKIEKVGSLHFKMVGYDENYDFGREAWPEGKERWCTGSFFVWSKKAIDEIGRMDEKYGLGGYDDWDWHHRMNHLADWKSVYTNGACYQHKDSSTLKTVPEKDKNTKNREYFKKKHGEYPEDIWAKRYPDQMEQPYRPFP